MILQIANVRAFRVIFYIQNEWFCVKFEFEKVAKFCVKFKFEKKRNSQTNGHSIRLAQMRALARVSRRTCTHCIRICFCLGLESLCVFLFLILFTSMSGFGFWCLNIMNMMQHASPSPAARITRYISISIFPALHTLSLSWYSVKKIKIATDVSAGFCRWKHQRKLRTNNITCIDKLSSCWLIMRIFN